VLNVIAVTMAFIKMPIIQKISIGTSSSVPVLASPSHHNSETETQPEFAAGGI
jgi:hypothetical protein